MNTRQKFSTFYLDGLLFGIEVEGIQEILRYQEMTPVPLAPSVVVGLINLRGQIVTAIDLRRRLGLKERASGLRPMNIVVRSDDDVLSLLVDEVGEVVEVGEETFESPPETMELKNRIMVRGVHKLAGQLMHILNTDEAVKLSSGTDGVGVGLVAGSGAVL